MLKTEFIKKLAAVCDETQAVAEKNVNGFLQVLTDALKEEGKMSFINFGSFEVRERKEKTIKLIGTGEEVLVPASKTVCFKCSKVLKSTVNE